MGKYVPAKKKKVNSKSERKKLQKEKTAQKKALRKAKEILNTRTINDDQVIKIYKDRNKKNHPSIELYFDEVNKKWVRVGEITHKKIKGQRYIDLDVNPNPDDTSPAFIRKYIESSKIGHRGEQIKKYKIHSSDVPKLINYLEKREEPYIKEFVDKIKKIVNGKL